jgi:ATP:ADP antiporter, AAA family
VLLVQRFIKVSTAIGRNRRTTRQFQPLPLDHGNHHQHHILTCTNYRRRCDHHCCQSTFLVHVVLFVLILLLAITVSTVELYVVTADIGVPTPRSVSKLSHPLRLQLAPFQQTRLHLSSSVTSGSTTTILGKDPTKPITTTTTTTTTNMESTQQQQQPVKDGHYGNVQATRGGGNSSIHTNSSSNTNVVSTTVQSDKGWWITVRETIFPIYGAHEVHKFLWIGSIKFFVILALTLTRDTKDTLVVTQCGAEAIAFLKIYGVLPAATAFIALYSQLSNILSKKTLFYVTCVPFFVFFAVFDLFIYPNVHILHPSIETVQKVLRISDATSVSGGWSVLANIFAHWTSAVYYVLAEIYSSVSVGLLFWQFANDVVSIDQAKRFYPLFAQMSGLAPVLAGQYMVHYASRAPNFAISLHRLTIAVTISGVMICFAYQRSCAYVERTESHANGSSSSSSSSSTKAGMKKKKKPKLSMTESAKFLASSQYLRLIAMLVLGYGLSINFTEIIWKSLVKKQYPNPLDYQRFMGNFSSLVGACTCIVIFFGVHVIRILGWRVGAMATPSIMAIVSIPFFTCILLGLDGSPMRLQTAVVCGTVLSLLSKTSKYALFDPTTQMAYIPLDDESKVKGKAAIDVLGSRIGKSGGSFIQQGLVFGFGNILSAAPAIAMIYYSVLFAWINAANHLSALFHAQTEMNNVDDVVEESKKVK